MDTNEFTFHLEAFIPTEKDFSAVGRLALMMVNAPAVLIVTPEEMQAFENASLLTTIANEVFSN